MNVYEDLLKGKYEISKIKMYFMGKFICKKCGKLKDYMDMNSKSLCKICWLKNDFNFYKNRFNRTTNFQKCI